MGKKKKPFLALIAQLIRSGVEVRLIYAKEPGPNFREDFDKEELIEMIKEKMSKEELLRMLLNDK